MLKNSNSLEKKCLLLTNGDGRFAVGWIRLLVIGIVIVGRHKGGATSRWLSMYAVHQLFTGTGGRLSGKTSGHRWWRAHKRVFINRSVFGIFT